MLLGSGLMRALGLEVALDKPMFKGSVQQGRGEGLASMGLAVRFWWTGCRDCPSVLLGRRVPVGGVWAEAF